MAEIADLPADVTLVRLTVPLVQVVGFMVALGCVVVVDRLSRALFGTLSGSVGWIPWLGQVVQAPIHRIEQRISSYLGEAAAALSQRIGASLHALGALVHTLGYEIESTGRLLGTVAYLIAARGAGVALNKTVGAIVGLVHRVDVRVARIDHRLGALERELTHGGRGEASALVHRLVQPLEGELHGLERWTYPRVKRLEHEVEHDLQSDIAALRRRVRTIEDGLLRVFRDAAGIKRITEIGAAAAVVAIALERLGLNWLRCRGVGRVGRALCGLGPALIEDLLGDALAAFAVADICDFAAGAEYVAQEIEPALIALVDVGEALVGCRGATAPPALPLPALVLPAANAGLVLG